MSKETSTKGQSIALAVIALLAGILVGVVGTHFFNISDETVTQVAGQKPTTDGPAAELRASLDTRLIEHAYLTQEAMVAEYENDPSAEQRFAALNTNTQELVKILGVLEGVDENNSVELAEEHVNYVRTYADAVREQDQETVRQTRDQLDTFTAVTADTLAAELDMPRDEVQESLDAHVAHMQRALDAHAAENYSEAYKIRREARSQMRQLSARLAAGIVDAYPEQYE